MRLGYFVRLGWQHWFQLFCDCSVLTVVDSYPKTATYITIIINVQFYGVHCTYRLSYLFYVHNLIGRLEEYSKSSSVGSVLGCRILCKSRYLNVNELTCLVLVSCFPI